MKPRWFDDLKGFWAEEGFDPRDKALLIAVSGGSDSVALLELFRREVAPGSGCRLFAVHVNHGLRPDSGADQSFVENLCRERGVPLHVERPDPAGRRPRQSPEMWGREHRYQAFARARKKFRADFTLTAHHRDDVVETFCLRLWRGTGFAGLAGIPFQGRGGALRPVLPLSRAELREWLASLGASWREDRSNADVNIPRNWVRHGLLPAWREREMGVEDRIFRIARETAKLIPAWEKWLEGMFPESEVRRRGGIPLEWLDHDEADAVFLRRLLPLSGIRTAPQLTSEILRQARQSRRGLRIRVDEATILTGQNGVLTAMKQAAGRD